MSYSKKVPAGVQLLFHSYAMIALRLRSLPGSPITTSRYVNQKRTIQAQDLVRAHSFNSSLNRNMARLPYPSPADETTSRRMSRIRKRDTGPELMVRRSLHARGWRYRVNHRVVTDDLAVRVDIAFLRQKLAIFIDGCFWHVCPEHGNSPNRNTAYWAPKLKRNVERDRRVDHALDKAGWQVLRYWEHEPSPNVVRAIEAALSKATGETRHS